MSDVEGGLANAHVYEPVIADLEAEVERLRGALEGIKARCDRIVAGEFGGLQAATEIANEARRALASNMGATDPSRPIHGDVWRSRVACRRFSVMHVCGHHDPPHVTGYWWRGDALDPNMHDSIPLPRFLASMDLVEREDFDA